MARHSMHKWTALWAGRGGRSRGQGGGSSWVPGRLRVAALAPLLLMGLLLLGLLPAVWGCTAGPITPAQALREAEADAAVGGWLRAHSAPAILAGMGPVDAKRWQQYHPAATVDLVEEGLLITYQARFGPQPRKLEVLLDRQTGAMLPPPVKR